MYHKPAPKVTAGAIPEVKAEARVVAEVMAGSQSEPSLKSLLEYTTKVPSVSQSRRKVTFQEPEVEPDSEGEEQDYLPERSILDIKTWLDWQACQLSTPCWWWELRANSGMKDPQKLTRKIWASFLIPKVRSRAFPGQDFTMPPAPKCLNRNAFLPDNLLYQDMWQQPFLLSPMLGGCNIGQRTLICQIAPTSTLWWEVS